MCLGIPGQITAYDGAELATADVIGVARTINVGLLRADGVEVGDWVLIHMGFAMEVIDQAEAATALEGLRLMGQGSPDAPEFDPGMPSGAADEQT